MTIEGGYRKYSEISFLRGFAITTVIFMHLFQMFVKWGDIPQWLSYASSLGGTGGHVFVFCSGFGLYLSYLHRPVRVGEFLKNRFLKIYIPYIIVVLIVYLLTRYGDKGELFRRMLSHIFLYKMFFERYVISFGMQFWFISTIIQLYLLFPLLCRLRDRTSLRTLVATGLLISMAWWILMEATGLGEYRIWGSFCFQYLWEFTLGMAAAEYLMNRESIRIPIWLLLTAAAVGLGLQAIMAMQGGWAAAFNDIPSLIGYGSAALLLYTFGKRIIRPLFLKIDTISYEWFLVHTIVIARFYRYFGSQIQSEALKAALATACSLVVAWIYAKLIRRLMKLLKV
ncbi:MAG: acyltransferase [Oscillospiraceae bacterium]|nr:acyltransferase [Oscillospiraceae bacterium]